MKIAVIGLKKSSSHEREGEGETLPSSIDFHKIAEETYSVICIRASPSECSDGKECILFNLPSGPKIVVNVFSFKTNTTLDTRASISYRKILITLVRRSLLAIKRFRVFSGSLPSLEFSEYIINTLLFLPFFLPLVLWRRVTKSSRTSFSHNRE